MLTGRTAGARLLVDGYVNRLCAEPSVETRELAPDVSDVHECVDCGQPDELCECPDDNSELGERNEEERRALRRAQRDDERADAMFAEARGK